MEFDLSIFMHSETWIALLTLTFLEIVLGIDNIIFISIVSDRLPKEQQARARNLGLMLALVFRVGLLMSITWILGFEEPVFSIFDIDFSYRDIILAAGGLFLLAKSTTEIFHKMEGEHGADQADKPKAAFSMVIIQIVLLDIVFSFDSILTAIGLTQQILIMVLAVIISMLIMMSFAGPISRFINKHPSLQILALAFLILIGFMLFLEALHQEIPKGYIYFAVFFSLVVEVVNMRVRRRKKATGTS